MNVSAMRAIKGRTGKTLRVEKQAMDLDLKLIENSFSRKSGSTNWFYSPVSAWFDMRMQPAW
jgi:hypothetical protein